MLFSCALPGDALNADSSATASIVINLGLLRRMARTYPLSDFRGPDWLMWTVDVLKRRISRVDEDDDDDEDDETKSQTWTVLSPLSFEQVIEDLSDP